MTALPLRNEWDWPDMGELDAYADARHEWEKQAGRLDALITMLNKAARDLENGPPFLVPAGWPDKAAFQEQIAALTAAWNAMVAAYNAIPHSRKSSAQALPTHAGYRAPIPS